MCIACRRRIGTATQSSGPYWVQAEWWRVYPQIAKRNRPPRTCQIRGIPQIRTGNESPVWAVGGDLLLVAVVRVDRPSDSDDQDVAGTRNFTATLNAYFPGLSSRDSMSAWPSSSMLRILNFETP
ncbi:hypothetical protein RHA1_ro11146 (plasmid) [Rhodococcus jostii RHA1]|uniref:Uncharacterized protein n=1 Tax=Rhodococcus jostii (strain RHA1) TaxID=101510 RepID=Q0RV93_RHOJR|nr:hypothetical protein RHA1_ro11146 [Rhodococcus jostii RHA1]